MSREKIILFIVAFWLFMPIPFMFTGLNNYNVVDTSVLTQDNITKPTLLDYIGTGITFLGMYFQFIFIWVSNVPIYINLFLWVLRFISAFILATAFLGG